MKKKYVTPTMVGERFSADEYVAACITGVIQCIYPGRSKYEYDDGISTVIGPEDGLWHGVCGNKSTISFNGNTAEGYEVVSGKTDYNRPIKNIQGYKEKADEYDVTWNSTDNNWKDTYFHRGKLTVTNIDNNRPNHS